MLVLVKKQMLGNVLIVVSLVLIFSIFGFPASGSRPLIPVLANWMSWQVGLLLHGVALGIIYLYLQPRWFLILLGVSGVMFVFWYFGETQMEIYRSVDSVGGVDRLVISVALFNLFILGLVLRRKMTR
jgi:hypothetical protein